jgi:hypothetical protein
MSALFETLSIPFFYLIARRVLQDKTAIAMATWLFALSFFQAQYARDARFYAVLVFFSLVSVYSLIEFLETRSFFLFVTLILSLAACLYTHNMMFFYLPGIALFWILYPSGPPLVRRVIDGLLCGLAVLLLLLPWLPNLISQTKSVTQTFWLKPPTFHDLADTVNVLSGLDSNYLPQFSSHLTHLNLLQDQGLFFVCCLFLLILCAFAGISYANPVNQRKAAAALGYTVVPVLLVFFYSRSARPVFLSRAFIASSATLPLVLAASIAYQMGRRKTLFTALVVVLIAATAISLLGFLRNYRKEDWRGATACLLSTPAEQRIVVFVANQGQVLFDYYATRSPNLAARPEETGLPEKYNYKDPVVRSWRDFKRNEILQPLQRVVDSRNFTIIDVVVSHSPLLVNKMVQKTLSSNYAVLAEEDFNQIKVTHWKRSDP